MRKLLLVLLCLGITSIFGACGQSDNGVNTNSEQDSSVINSENELPLLPVG